MGPYFIIGNMDKKELLDLRRLALTVVDRWRAQGRPLIAAFIHGSSARQGSLAVGSDLDVSLVVPTPPDPAWFEECALGNAVVELFRSITLCSLTPMRCWPIQRCRSTCAKGLL